MKLLFLVAVTALAFPVQAATVYSNDFDSENGGATALGYTGLTGFTVADGSIDLIHTGDGFGITCAGGSGGCLDLDGSTGAAGLLFSTADYAFAAGDLVSLRYAISGSQRLGYGTDGYGIGFGFNQATSGSFTFTTSSGIDQSGAFAGEAGLGVGNAGVEYNRGFTSVTLTIRPTASGSFFLYVDGLSPDPADSSNDNVGLVLDDLRVDVSAVPEAATWAMMIGGLGGVGARLRRRGRVRATVRFA